MTSTATDRTFLYNANVLTLDPGDALATGLLIEDGRVAQVVHDGDVISGGDRMIDLEGATILPGFIDPHCHPLALGAAMASIDCSPATVSSVAEIGERIARAAADTPSGWIRARGHDELLLAEKRHPNAVDLDVAAPGRLIRLSHGSGHGDVLSSAAMSALGINRTTVVPPGGTIECDSVTGEPTGVLFEMGGWIRDRLPKPSEIDLQRYAKTASDQLVGAGVTSVTDAGRDNSADKLALYSGLTTDGRFMPRPTVMLSPEACRTGVENTRCVRIGATKIAITFSGGEMHPEFDALVETIRTEHHANRQVAIHAVELEAVIMATEAFAIVGSRIENLALRHRLEHASECPPEVARNIADAGLSVVTQPGFIHERGDRYLIAQRSGGSKTEDLYAAKNLIDAGVHVAASSDAPVGPASPLIAIQAAVTRNASGGGSVGPSQAISVGQALRMYGPNAAWMNHLEAEIGTIEPGKRADLVVLQNNPHGVDPQQIGSIPVLATLIGGKTVSGTLPGN
ncbi:MAG: amidohydrolase [Chloroflexi bacterium]|nr:amidohydrolase [Chloroflexota bacterium]